MGQKARLKQFKLGKYDIRAEPAAGSAHMLRYTVMLDGKRLGALLSMPTESDCRFLESPPKVPPLKIFQVTFRPGRPKKGTRRPDEAARKVRAFPGRSRTSGTDGSILGR